jgi:hypothetical protein
MIAFDRSPTVSTGPSSHVVSPVPAKPPIATALGLNQGSIWAGIAYQLKKRLPHRALSPPSVKADLTTRNPTSALLSMVKMAGRVDETEMPSAASRSYEN